MTPLLVVGGPVSNRAWILDHWFNYVEWAVSKIEGPAFDVHYVFVGDPSADLKTFEIIHARAKNYTLVEIEEWRTIDERSWTTERKEKMVVLRNLVLDKVRDLNPNLFLSLDSDILLHPEALQSMLMVLMQTEWDAVGGKCYMTPLPKGPAPSPAHRGTAAPSFLFRGRAGNWRRRDPESEAIFEVDVIMAIKLMTPAAYAVDYEYHAQGEDIGWSIAAKDAGLRLGWDGQVISKHVMMPEHLHMLDPRCGY